MKKLVLLAGLLLAVTCSPDPLDRVRELRRRYKLNIDLTINETLQATYEIKVQNLTGSKELQEITVLVRLLDEKKEALWTSQKKWMFRPWRTTRPKPSSFKETVPGDVEKNYSYFDVVPAPDLEGDGYKEYKEFKRVM